MSSDIEAITNSQIYCEFLSESLNVSPFIKTIDKSTIFSTSENIQELTTSFGSNFSWIVPSIDDYMYNQILRVEISDVVMNNSLLNSGLFLRWCRNLGHNILKSLTFKVGTTELCSIDSEFMDLHITKTELYDRMIGNIDDVINPLYSSEATKAQTIKGFVLNIPIPFPFNNSTQALPTYLLKQSVMKIEGTLRNWNELLVTSNFTKVTKSGVTAHSSRNTVLGDLTQAPTCTIKLISEYAKLTATESNILSKKNKKLVWDIMSLSKSDTRISGTNINYSHSLSNDTVVKNIYASVVNDTISNDRSNYTTGETMVRSAGVTPSLSTIMYPAPYAINPIKKMGIKYGNTDRVVTLDSDFFDQVQAWKQGYKYAEGRNIFSYAIKYNKNANNGSTQFDGISNPLITFQLSDDVIGGLNGTISNKFYNENGEKSMIPAGYSLLDLNLTSIASKIQKYKLVVRSLTTRVYIFNQDGTVFIQYV